VKEISEINKKINKSAAAPAQPKSTLPPLPPGVRVTKGGLNFENPYPNE
jgi:hypothetical protein